MKRHEQLLEDYEDAYFALLMEAVAEQEGERLDKLNQELQNDPSFVVPEALDRKCLKTIEDYFSHQRRQTALRSTLRVLHLVAILVALSVLLATVAFAISPDFRIATRNLLIRVSDRYTDFSMEIVDQNDVTHTSNQNQENHSFFDNLEVGWIPAGFQVSKNEYNHFVFYENEIHEWVQILFADDQSTVQVDTENADVSETTILDLPAVIVKKDGETTILLVNKEYGYFYLIITSRGVGIETTTKIAQNLIIL